MTHFKIKGNEFDITFTTHSSMRSATAFRNKIILTLKKIGIPSHHIKLKEERLPFKKAGAEIYWYVNGFNCYYNYNRQEKYIDNLQVICTLLEIEVLNILEGAKDIQEFIADFKEDDNLLEKRKEARALLKLEENETNLETINKKYKHLAKELHPDTAHGSTEKFKQLNEAHKILKQELE